MYYRTEIMQLGEVYESDKYIYESCVKSVPKNVVLTEDNIIKSAGKAILKALQWLWNRIKDIGKLIVRLFNFITGRNKKSEKKVKEIQDAEKNGIPKNDSQNNSDGSTEGDIVEVLDSIINNFNTDIENTEAEAKAERKDIADKLERAKSMLKRDSSPKTVNKVSNLIDFEREKAKRRKDGRSVQDLQHIISVLDKFKKETSKTPALALPSSTVDLGALEIPESLNKTLLYNYYTVITNISGIVDMLNDFLTKKDLPDDEFGSPSEEAKKNLRGHSFIFSGKSVDEFKTMLYKSSIYKAVNGSPAFLHDIAMKEGPSTKDEMYDYFMHQNKGKVTYQELININDQYIAKAHSGSASSNLAPSELSAALREPTKIITYANIIQKQLDKKIAAMINFINKDINQVGTSDFVQSNLKVTINNINAACPQVLADCVMLAGEQSKFTNQFIDYVHNYLVNLGYPTKEQNRKAAKEAITKFSKDNGYLTSKGGHNTLLGRD